MLKMNQIIVHLVGAAVTTPIITGLVAHVYSDYHAFYGVEKHYPKPNWDIGSDPMLEERRNNLVKVVKDALELKNYDVKEIDECMTDDVIWEDPYLLCKGKEEMKMCFSILPKVYSRIEIHQFDVTHHPHFICVAQKKDYHFWQHTVKRTVSSNLIFLLDKSEGKEKIKKLTDEWNARAIPTEETSGFPGYCSEVMRRARSVIALERKSRTKYGSWTNDIYYAVKEFFAGPSLSDEEKALRKALDEPVVAKAQDI